MGKKSPPPAPDFTKAAELQAQSAKDNLATQTAANRPNQVTPWGQQTWSSTPGQNGQSDQWTQTTTLSPQQQQALDSQMNVSNLRSQGASAMLRNALSGFGVDMNQLQSGQGGQSGPPGQGGQSGKTPGNIPQPGQGGSGGDQTGSQPGSTPIDYRGLSKGATALSAPNQMGRLPDSAGPLNSNVNFDRAQAGSVGGGGGSSGPLKYQMDNTAGDWRQKGQDAALKFQEPLNQQRTSALESQLANMGLTRGSEAWNNEMRNNADQTMRNQYQAFGAGQSEASQLFNHDLQGSQFTNSARGQEFDNSYKNAALSQQAGIANAQNSLQAQGMNNQNALLAAQFGNQAQNQGFQQSLALAQAGDQQSQNKLAMQMQAGGFNQNIRQQQIAEMMAQRSQPLNELNALLSGQQIQSPNMPSFMGAGVAPGTNYSGAANQTYQSQMDAFNAQQAGTAGLMSGVGGLAGAFFGGPAGAAAGSKIGGSFSDKRLKDNIKPLFSLGGDNNFKLYSFNFKPTGERKVGVLAQEVQKKRPDAVMRDPASGFLKVDYNKVFQ